MAAIAVGCDFEDVRPLAGPAVRDGFLARSFNRKHVHTVDLHARNSVAVTALG